MAVPDLVQAASEADFIFFSLPYSKLRTVCSTLLGMIKPTAVGFSLIKGFDRKEQGGIDLISKIIHRYLRIPCYVLMGATTACKSFYGLMLITNMYLIHFFSLENTSHVDIFKGVRHLFYTPLFIITNNSSNSLFNNR